MPGLIPPAAGTVVNDRDSTMNAHLHDHTCQFLPCCGWLIHCGLILAISTGVPYESVADEPLETTLTVDGSGHESHASTVVEIIAPAGGRTEQITIARASQPRANTFSIVAFDPATGDLGIAVASKVLGVGS